MIEPGTVIGHDFRVLHALSEGGMGAVFVAEQISTGRRRALKLMKAELARDTQFRARFELEARAGARIASEHVVEVVAAGITDDGQPWLAMELLTGQSLDDYVRQEHALPLEEARLFLGHICHAIAAAHRVGIVHRDLKPENIFIAQSQREGVQLFAKVLDFGIAKVIADTQSVAHSRTASIGTPLWMAPEQADARGIITAATDIWPLGLIAFYMLTGTTYWLTSHASGSVASLIREISFDPLAPASMRAAELDVGDRLPIGFDDWFGRCVARDPSRRFRSVDEVKDGFFALRAAPATSAALASTLPDPTAALAKTAPAAPAPGHSPSVRSPSTRSRAWLGLLISVSALIATVLVLGVYVGARRRVATAAVSDAAIERRLQRAELTVPATSPRAGDLLSLAKTDPTWGSTLPLTVIVVYCSLTDAICARNVHELDEMARRSQAHVQVRWRHAVPYGDTSARLAAEAAQGAFETGGSAAFIQLRDLAFSHHGAISETEIMKWAKEITVPDPEDFVIRFRRHEWRSVVEKDSAAYARTRISTPGFMWANCNPLGLKIEDTSRLFEDAAHAALDAPGQLDLGAFYIERCAPTEELPLRLAPSEISPFAAPGSDDWARRVVLEWAVAVSTQDADALMKTYAPRVALENKEMSRDDAIRATLASIGRSQLAISSSTVIEKDDDRGWHVQLIHAELPRSSALAKTAETTFIVRETPSGWAIGDVSTNPQPQSCEAALLALVASSDSGRARLFPPRVGDSASHEGVMVLESKRKDTSYELLARRIVAGRAVDARDLDWGVDMTSTDFVTATSPSARPHVNAAALENARRACGRKTETF